MDLPKNGVCVANALRARHDALASPIYSLAKEASVCLLCSLNVHGQLRPRWWRAALKLFWPYHFHASLIFAERSISLFLPSCKTRRLVLLLNFEWWCRGTRGWAQKEKWSLLHRESFSFLSSLFWKSFENFKIVFLFVLNTFLGRWRFRPWLLWKLRGWRWPLDIHMNCSSSIRGVCLWTPFFEASGKRFEAARSSKSEPLFILMHSTFKRLRALWEPCSQFFVH